MLRDHILARDQQRRRVSDAMAGVGSVVFPESAVSELLVDDIHAAAPSLGRSLAGRGARVPRFSRLQAAEPVRQNAAGRLGAEGKRWLGLRWLIQQKLRESLRLVSRLPQIIGQRTSFVRGENQNGRRAFADS